MKNTNKNKQTVVEQKNAAKTAAADELTAARDNAIAAFKTAAKSASSQTTAALEFVAAYYAAKGSVIIDKETKSDLRQQWKEAGNTQKYESAVFYRVCKTCEKNAALVAAAFENGKDAAAAAGWAKTALLAVDVGLTSCKSAAAKDAAAKDAATKDAATKDAATKDAATKDAATKDAAADRLQMVLDYIGVCSESAFRAVAAAVEKRRAVAEKMSKTA